MGNSQDKSDDSFKMNVCVIGHHIDYFYEILSQKNSIKNCWTFKKGIGNDISTCITDYFLELEKMKNQKKKLIIKN